MSQLSLIPPPDLPTELCALITAYGYGAVLTELHRLHPTDIAPSAPARWGDPETSQMAAKRSLDVGRFSEKSRQAKLLNQFSIEPRTDQQATMAIVGTHAAPSAFDGCRRRCSDLRSVYYLYDTGKRHKNLGSDDESIVWGVSEAGRQALISLETTGVVAVTGVNVTAAQAKAMMKGKQTTPVPESPRKRTTRKVATGGNYATTCVLCAEVFHTIAAEDRHLAETGHPRYALVLE